MDLSLEPFYEQLGTIQLYVVLGMVIIEWLALTFMKKIESHTEGLVNIGSHLLELVSFTLGGLLIYEFMVWIYQFRIFELGYQWYVFVLAFVAFDFMFFAVHYLGHRVRFFWCIHGVHHTAKEMKLTVAVRGSFLNFLSYPLIMIFLPLLGLNPFVVYIAESFCAIYGLYAHINASIVGRQVWLEGLLITPSLHRLHHARNHEYLDRNYGQTFSLWDRLFGTFQTEIDGVRSEFGLLGDDVSSTNLWQVQTKFWVDLWRDMRSAPRWSDKLRYLVHPPGWNHVDGGMLSEDYRRAALGRHLDPETSAAAVRYGGAS